MFGCLGNQGDWASCLSQGLDVALKVWLVCLGIAFLVFLLVIARFKKAYKPMTPEVKAIFVEAFERTTAQPQDAPSIAVEFCAKVPQQYRRLLARFIYNRSGRLRGMNAVQRWRYATDSIQRQGLGPDSPGQRLAS